MRSRATVVLGGAAVVIAAFVYVTLRRPSGGSAGSGSTSADARAPVRFVPTGPPKTLGPDRGFTPVPSTLRDKPTRDDLRERIYRASGKAPPEFTVGHKQAENEAQVLDKEYIAKRLRDD